MVLELKINLLELELGFKNMIVCIAADVESGHRYYIVRISTQLWPIISIYLLTKTHKLFTHRFVEIVVE